MNTIYELDTSNFLSWDDHSFSGEVIMSLFVILFIILLSFVIFFIFRKRDPLKPDKGFVLVVETLVEKLDAFVLEVMGRKWMKFAGYVLGLAMFILFSFLIGITGLPNPLTSLTVPLSLGLCTFVLIHVTAIKANHWRYFKRYVDPVAVFLPVNLLSMWAPLISISLRLFGNALSGYCLMSIVYYFLRLAASAITQASMASAASIWLAPLIAPFFHLYFDVFSGAIQTLIFCILTMIWISNEDPDEEEEKQASVKGEAVTE